MNNAHRILYPATSHRDFQRPVRVACDGTERTMRSATHRVRQRSKGHIRLRSAGDRLKTSDMAAPRPLAGQHGLCAETYKLTM
jgi:hypothetical protein